MMLSNEEEFNDLKKSVLACLTVPNKDSHRSTNSHNSKTQTVDRSTNQVIECSPMSEKEINFTVMGYICAVLALF